MEEADRDKKKIIRRKGWSRRQMIICRAFIKDHNLSHVLQLSMLDWPLLLWMKSPVADRIHPQSNKFALGMKNKVTCHSKPKDSGWINGWTQRCREGRKTGRKDGQTDRQTDSRQTEEWMKGGMEREKKGKSPPFPNNDKTSCC